MAGSTAALVSKLPFSAQEVFLPLNPENTAAKKHKIAATMKAVVSALMNGEAMALGKKDWPSRMFRVFWDSPAATGPIPRSNVPMGL